MISSALSVQVVPHGMHSGLMGGFAIATLEGGIDVLCAETAVRGPTTDDQDDVTAAIERFEAIRAEALPLSMSLELIKRTAEERWTRARHDGANQPSPATTAEIVLKSRS
jgi:hypothetical protein